MCGLVSRRFDDVNVVSHHTEREDMVVSQDDHALLFPMLGTAGLSHTIVLNADFTALWNGICHGQECN